MEEMMQHLLTSLARGYREFRLLSKVLSPELRRLYWTLLVLPHGGAIGLMVLVFTITPYDQKNTLAFRVFMTAIIGAVWIFGIIVSIGYHKQLRREYLWTVGLCDSDTGESLRVLKTVHITGFCPNIKEGRVMLKFTKAKRGRIVQIDNNEFCIHFFVDELDAEMDARDDPFGSAAGRLGLDKMHLRSLIELHAPT